MNTRKIIQFSIGPAGTALLGLISLPIITRTFSQGDIGRITMLQIIANLCVLLFGLGLDQAYVREYHEAEDKPQLFKGVFLPGLSLLITTIILFLILPNSISLLLFGFEDQIAELLVIFGILASFIARFLSLILRMQERALAYSISQILPKVIFVFIVAIYLFLDVNDNFIELLFANVISNVATTGILIWNTRSEIDSSIFRAVEISKLIQMLRYGLPLIIGGLAYWGLATSDRIFLRIYSTYSQLGIYSVAFSFAMGATIFSNVFSTVWAPTVYKWAANNESLEKIDQVTEYVLSIVVIVFSLSGMFSSLVVLFLPQGYESVQYILVACLSYPLLYTLSETTVVGLGISKKTIYAMLASIVSLVINIIGNWLLIPIYGAAGAAVSTALSFWFFLFLRTEFSCLLWRKLPRGKLYFFSLFSVLIANLTALAGESLGRWLLFIWMIFLTVSCRAFIDTYKFGLMWFFSSARKIWPDTRL